MLKLRQTKKFQSEPEPVLRLVDVAARLTGRTSQSFIVALISFVFFYQLTSCVNSDVTSATPESISSNTTEALNSGPGQTNVDPMASASPSSLPALTPAANPSASPSPSPTPSPSPSPISKIWSFDLPSQYTYNNSYLLIKNGSANLRQSFEDAGISPTGTPTGISDYWPNTSSTNLSYSPAYEAIVLESTSQGGRPLPDAGSTTSWLSMSTNVVLLHFDEASFAINPSPVPVISPSPSPVPSASPSLTPVTVASPSPLPTVFVNSAPSPQAHSVPMPSPMPSTSPSPTGPGSSSPVPITLASPVPGSSPSPTVAKGYCTSCPTLGATGQVGTGVTFNGSSSSQSITLSKATSLTTADIYTGNVYGTDLTVSLWLTGSSLNNFAIPLQKTSTSSLNDGYGFYYSSTSGFCGWVGDYSSGKACASLEWSQSVFHHIVLTYTNSVVTLYVNGMAMASTTYAAATLFSSHQLTVGSGLGGSTWNGTIDEVAVFSSALTATEAFQLYITQVAASTGTFISSVFDEGASATGAWVSLGYSPLFPAGKPIPETDETAYQSGNSTTTDLKLLLHFDEAVSSGTFPNPVISPGPTGYSILSSDTTDLAAAGGITRAVGGKFKQAVYFDGVNDAIKFSSGNTGFSGIQFTSSFTLSFWIQPFSPVLSSSSNSHTIPLILYTDSGWSTGYGVVVESGKVCFFTGSYSSSRICSSANTLKPHHWNHVVASYNASSTTIKLLTNGQSAGSFTSASAPTPVTESNYTILYLGNFFAPSPSPTPTPTTPSYIQPYKGKLDELAIWGRALTDTEQVALYKRGATRLQIQLADTCSNATCSTATFKGEYALSSPAPTPSVAPIYVADEQSNSVSTLPSITPWTSVAAARYLQYKVIFDTFDSNYSPGLRSVTPVSSPAPYTYPSPVVTTTALLTSIQTQTYLTADTLTSFAASGAATLKITYQLSVDGTNWYYASAVTAPCTWTLATATTVAQSNTEANANTCITNFLTTSRTGKLYIKAIFNSDGATAIQLDSITVNATRTIQ